MGVDYYSCQNCGDTFPDCGWYITCHGNRDWCNLHWCSEKCAEKDGVVFNEEDEATSCKFCRGEDLDDYLLVPFLLSQLGWTREEAVVKYQKKREELK